MSMDASANNVAFMCNLSWDSMNSQVKDALTEFINNNTSAIEQAMENGSHDLTKDEPVIPDLVNYLSCPTPQPCNKDVEPMSTNEKPDTHIPSFDSVDRQTHFNSCQLHDIPEANQFSAGSQMCVTNGDPVLNQVPSLSHQDLQQQHCLSQHNSFEPNTSLYSDSSIQANSTNCAFQDAQSGKPSAFAGSNSSGSSSTDIHTALNTGASEPQYCHTEQTGQFQLAADLDKHNQQTQFMSTDNCAGQLQARSESSSSGFQDSSVLSSFTSSVNSEVSFGQDGLGFGLLNVSQDSLSNLESVASQFRSPEKMHVDEPESIFEQTGSIDHFQAGAVHTTRSPDVHMQAFSSDAFNAASDFVAQQTPSITDSGLQDCTAASVAGQFSSPTFQQNPSVLQGCVDFQTQPNIHAAKEVIADQAHYLSQQPENSGSSEASFSCAAQHACGSSQANSYQPSQYYNSPGHCNTSPSVAETFQTSLPDTDAPAASPACGQSHQFDLISNKIDSGHYQQSAASLQSHQLDLGKFHQNSALDMSYSPNVSLAHCQGQPSVSFHTSVVSGLSNPVLFPASTPAGSQNQPNDYLSNSVNTAPSQVNDSTAFIGCSTGDDPLLSAGMCSSASQGSVPQSLPDFQMSTASSQEQGVTASSKTSGDVTMRDFSLEGNLHSSSHRFTDDAFSHLDLEAVVNSLSVETNPAAAPQNDSMLSTVSYQPSYTEYDYNRLASATVGFQGISHPVADSSTFHEQSTSDVNFTSCTPALSTASFVSGACDDSSHSQFGSSSFAFPSTLPVAGPAYHQPMQVQDSEPHVTYSYPSTHVSERVVNNTETAMDVSSSLLEKGAGLSSRMSYEEIHMSIVKAGNELSKEAHGTNILDPHGVFGSSPAQTANLDSLDNVSALFSTPSSDTFPADKSDNSVAANYHTGTQASAMITSPGNKQHENSFSCEISACSNTSLSDSISSSSVDTSMFSGMLSDLQAASTSSSQLLHEGQVTQSSTVPNFLENTGPVSSNIHTDNLSAASTMLGQPHSNFIITIAATPTVSKTLVANAGLNQSQVVAMQHGNIAISQQQPVELSAVSQTCAPGNPQIFAADMNPAQASTASFLGQLEPAGIDPTRSQLSTCQVVLAPGLTGASVDSVSGASSGVFLHITPAHVDRASALPATSVSSLKLATNTLTTQQPSNTPLAGPTSVSVPIVNPSQVLANSVSKQPHIIASLEELQKLLAQQNLSQPSPSVPQQQPYTTLSSPQTLVLQKHASHSLKQSQPRLLIKGATLPSQPRLGHPHPQLQQTREKLQLLLHQSHPSEHIPVGKISQRSLEPSAFSAAQEKVSNPFHFVAVNQLDHMPQSKLHVLQHSAEPQPKVKLQLKPAQLFQRQPQTVNLFLQPVPKPGDQRLAPLQLGQQQIVLPEGQQKAQTDHKPFVHIESHFQNVNLRGQTAAQKTQDVIQLAQMQQELLLLLKQEEKGQEFENQQLQHFHLKHQQHLEKPEKTDRACSDSLKKDYKHLHSLLTGETTGGGTQTKVVPAVLNLSTNSPGQAGLQLASGGSIPSMTASQTLSSVTQISTAPFSLIPLNTNASLQLTATSSTPSTLTFVKSMGASASKSFDGKDCKVESSSCPPSSLHAQYPYNPEQCGCVKDELDVLGDHMAAHQLLPSIQTSTERKRSHTPLSVDLNSPANSGSEPASPLSSPTICEDGNTQLTLIERSADLHIKSDSMLGVEDDVDDNSSFDINAFHKRPSAGECHSTRGNRESVPMKIAKSSIHTIAHMGVNSSTSPESTFDFGSAVTSASSFSFVFGNKEDNSSEVFTFGLSGTATTTATTATDTLPHKDGAKPYRLSASKPVMKTVGMRATVPTQSVRPSSRKQKEYSLKAYYPSKLDGMELKILEQPEPQHRARYQTEGSRGAIKDASQQGFPVIKLSGYNKPAKLQVFIGDECGRVKPHGFYQACRVFGKNSTTCVEQEIEDTTVIEIEMLPENDMTVKLDCVGILKLRNADVERRIGPKRAREKKKTNTRARLVMRCLVDKSDGNQQILQAVSNPIVCTQPVGQPEISRMSLSESTVLGGDSLFIIGKNFKNKGTSVLFQKLDSNEESVVWQVEADIEQEFFQPTHLICKIPPYQDTTVGQPQMAQIVISCAGKRSDPQTFMYTPVVRSSVKHDIPMDTDHTLSTQPVSFVSSEALHLNRLVHLANAHPASTTTIMFQLPQGSLTSRQTTAVELTPKSISSQTSQSVKLPDHATTTAPVVVMTSSTTSSAALPVTSRSVSSNSMTAVTSGQGQPSFLLEDKFKGMAPEPPKDGSERSAAQSSVPGGSQVNCIVHSNSDTRTISAVSYAVSDNHQQPSLTSSAAHVPHSNKLSTNKSASVPSKPFFLVLDPVALQSNAGSEKIQQLLQHILEAQSKACHKDKADISV